MFCFRVKAAKSIHSLHVIGGIHLAVLERGVPEIIFIDFH